VFDPGEQELPYGLVLNRMSPSAWTRGHASAIFHTLHFLAYLKSPNGAGWGWDKDVAGALSFLGKPEDVDPDRIGALGLSTGANVLLEVAAERKDLSAVVADGAGMRSCADFRALDGGAVWLGAPVFCTMFAAQRVFSGSSPDKPLKNLVARIAPTPLLLIAGGRGQFERDFNLIWAKAAREPVELWDLPDVDHTKALHERPIRTARRRLLRSRAAREVTSPDERGREDSRLTSDAAV
jgi:fermentation-respiration switch protein FrsA (DUF1100 family)